MIIIVFCLGFSRYPGTFLLYSGISVLGFIFVFTMLPETKDKPLEEVIDLFAQPLHSSSCCSGGRSHIRYTKLKVGKLYTGLEGIFYEIICKALPLSDICDASHRNLRVVVSYIFLFQNSSF